MPQHRPDQRGTATATRAPWTGAAQATGRHTAVVCRPVAVIGVASVRRVLRGGRGAALVGLDQLVGLSGAGALLGVVAAFDAPARQTFVGDLVGTKMLGNAVALNSASVNAAPLGCPGVERNTRTTRCHSALTAVTCGVVSTLPGPGSPRLATVSATGFSLASDGATPALSVT